MKDGRVRVGLAGLGYWGPNLARNFGDLPQSDLAWLCDADPEHLDRIAARHPGTETTAEFDDLLADESLDAVVIATPVVTHADLTRRALAAGKNVFVEKPMALNAEEAGELVALAEERDLVLMPGHLLLYHPGVRKLKELIDTGELGDVHYVYGNRQNLGKVRKDENALGSLGAHDLSVILYLLEEEPVECHAHGESYLSEGIEDVVFCFLRFPSGKVAHMHLSWLDPHKMRRMTVVGAQKMAVFDDMELDRKVTIYDQGAEQSLGTYGEWRTRSGDTWSPWIPNDEPLRLECGHFLRLVRGEDDRFEAARAGLAVVRTLEQLQRSLERERV
ncbi:MAG TPA: Gfo/Idh/MocA family oxidoreductase [Gaiellaceae bacterium]|jgi:predicted dehydrogenase